MCLFICDNCALICKEIKLCCISCVRSCNPLWIVLGPAGLLVSLAAGITSAVYYLPSATYNHATDLWKHVMDVIRRGREAYSTDPSRQPKFFDCCFACAAEAYCCLTPFFALITLLMPVWLLFFMLALAFCGGISGCCAGCVSEPTRWWPAIRAHVANLDRELSVTAMRPPGDPRLFGPTEGQLPTHVYNEQQAHDRALAQRLQDAEHRGCAAPPTSVPPPTNAHMYGHTAPPPGAPAQQRPPQQQQRQPDLGEVVAGAARDAAWNVASSVAQAGVRSLLNATRPPPTATQPQHTQPI